MKPNAISDAHSSAESPDGIGPDAVITLGQRIDRMCSAAEVAWNGGCVAIGEFRAALDITGRVDRNPYGMMFAAIGSGYLLGGGLFTPLTARVVGLGLRLAAVPFIQREFLGIAEAALDGDSPSASAGERIEAT